MKKNAFSLVEMLLYMGILSIFLFVLTEIFTSTLNVQLESEATSSVTQDGRFLIARVSYDVERAQSIVTPASLGATSTTLQLTIDGINYTYGLNAGNLELTGGSGTDRLNSFDTTISNLEFKRLGNLGGKDTIQLSFTITSVTERPGGPEIKNFQTTVGLR